MGMGSGTGTLTSTGRQYKTSRVDDLLMEFPWLWAMCDSWSVGPRDRIPKVTRVTRALLKEPIGPNDVWWVVFQDNPPMPRVGQCVKRLRAETIGVALAAASFNHGMEAEILFLAKRRKGDSRQSITVYKPPFGMASMNLLILGA